MTTKSSFASSDYLSSNQFNMMQKSKRCKSYLLLFGCWKRVELGNGNLVTKFAFRQDQEDRHVN